MFIQKPEDKKVTIGMTMATLIFSCIKAAWENCAFEKSSQGLLCYKINYQWSRRMVNTTSNLKPML